MKSALTRVTLPLLGLVTLFGFASSACFGPGGGGGGGALLPCVANPSLPQCAVADAGADGVTGGDTVNGDTTGSETGGPETGSEVIGPDADGCNVGESRCLGATIQTCNGSSWVDVATCQQGEICNGGICVPGTCQPDCTGKTCGDDGCGGSCGECEFGDCQEGACVCTAVCTGECGPDGCGGSCGGCVPGESCVEGQCVEPVCTPSCSGLECGDDGCGGSCGGCVPGESCVEGECVEPVCTPSCSGLECGPDGCGGSCGGCVPGASCINGQCEGQTGGTQTCAQVNQCAIDCDQDTACIDSCVSQGTSTAQSEFQAISSCIDGCTSWLCLVQSGCASLSLACNKPTTGSSGCWDLQLCAQGCSGDQNCVQGCFDNASLLAHQQNLEIGWCINNYCEQGDSACVEQVISSECSSYVAACQNNN